MRTRQTPERLQLTTSRRFLNQKEGLGSGRVQCKGVIGYRVKGLPVYSAHHHVRCGMGPCPVLPPKHTQPIHLSPHPPACPPTQQQPHADLKRKRFKVFVLRLGRGCGRGGPSGFVGHLTNQLQPPSRFLSQMQTPRLKFDIPCPYMARAEQKSVRTQ